MYGKIFGSIFDSTLVADGGWMPTYVFMSMIVLADQDGVVDVAPKALYRRLGFRDYDSKISYTDFEAALEYLQQADTDSRSDLNDGKRLIPLSEVDEIDGNRGFLIVNYAFYRNRASKDDKRRQAAARKRRQRAREAQAADSKDGHADVTPGHTPSRMSRHTDTDTDTDTEDIYTRAREGVLTALPPNFEPDQETIDYCSIHNLADPTDQDTIEDFKLHYQAKPRLVENWQMLYRKWVRNKRVFDKAGGQPGRRKTKFEEMMDAIDESVES